MLSIPTTFPQVGSYGFMDVSDAEGRDAVERVRILRNNGDGSALISLTGHRYPREIASGNRTVPLSSLRATEQPEPAAKRSPRPKTARATAAKARKPRR